MSTSLEQIASCIDGYDPAALPVAQAKEFIARLVRHIRRQPSDLNPIEE